MVNVGKEARGTHTMNALSFGIAYKTENPVSEIETWLETNCSGDWDVSVAGIDDHGTGQMKKKLEIYFEMAGDRDKFRDKFVKR